MHTIPNFVIKYEIAGVGITPKSIILAFSDNTPEIKAFFVTEKQNGYQWSSNMYLNVWGNTYGNNKKNSKKE